MSAYRSKLVPTNQRMDNGARMFRQTGRELRFFLIDGTAIIDRCRVQDFPGDIQDTFNELCRLHGRTDLTYRTEAL